MQDNEKEKNITQEINLQAVYDIPLQVRVVLGSTDLKLNQILKLSKGEVVELDKKVGDPVDLFVGDRLVAKGEIVLVDNKVGVTLTELAKSEQLS
ncbi:MAG: Flagellar motor switch/type III secretory pathway protein FliN [Candidatus Midichloria mitochondrii]|uniref:Flagellar motor switch protein FliN n=2 Tax=Candidatus Midichloria mitochondrii TaxID=234827 RepID=F7XVL9_MIDMI|nr:flagellar motor switch protein FliN [Candidatus Midichloria mitochondrii]AEI88718.1 flagellar motor switch protein FliN [Candidatus Midichloria mitochondrii IricVA]MDJ1256173.1 flagellar motor switch protein FliN [Candidatus Midichloria mitochondrii]MDJ1287892.1 flagellar motor switch protein FliN [Candidatus Midichloria mitochondrii]MDJ1298714.1 flagellar motor switch protein FliN [Candidatus Midichloria mitochondrii]MDJ1312935.1 flagellar motor switch protein FliN [Candidatus Midichloria 